MGVRIAEKDALKPGANRSDKAQHTEWYNYALHEIPAAQVLARLSMGAGSRQDLSWLRPGNAIDLNPL
jgi:hypothetical protein